MTKREKQQLIRQLREVRESLQSVLDSNGKESERILLRRYDTAAVKAIFVLDDALLTLST